VYTINTEIKIKQQLVECKTETHELLLTTESHSHFLFIVKRFLEVGTRGVRFTIYGFTVLRILRVFTYGFLRFTFSVSRPVKRKKFVNEFGPK